MKELFISDLNITTKDVDHERSYLFLSQRGFAAHVGR